MLLIEKMNETNWWP